MPLRKHVNLVENFEHTYNELGEYMDVEKENEELIGRIGSEIKEIICCVLCINYFWYLNNQILIKGTLFLELGVPLTRKFVM